jgi:hypothetical protein
MVRPSFTSNSSLARVVLLNWKASLAVLGNKKKIQEKSLVLTMSIDTISS